ncbi:MAG: mechanosensitive ion channel family protein [Leptolyngbyaceae bacterium]|nr:mechanosensitive ion channel family protein [Leptolyngbyaceae bacterium]
MNHYSKHLRSIIQFCVRSLLACGLVVLLAAPGTAQQLSPILLPTNHETQKVLGWNPNQAYECGRLLCSDVILPGTMSSSFTLAQQLNPGDSRDELEVTVEERANLIENIVASIQRTMLEQRRMAWIEGESSLPQRDRHFYQNRIMTQIRQRTAELLSGRTRPDADLELHPDTPAVEVGIRNNQMVVFIPEQAEYGLPQQTIVTVTEPDLLHAGIRIPRNDSIEANGSQGDVSGSENAGSSSADMNSLVTNEDLAKQYLAQRWRMTIRQRLSDALWGQDHDWQYPHDRFGVAVAIVSVAIGLIFGVDWLQNLLRGRRRQLKQRSKQLQQALMKNRESAAMEGPVKDDSGNVVNVVEEGPSPVSVTDSAPSSKQSTEIPLTQTNKHDKATMLSAETLSDISLDAVIGLEQAVKDQFQYLIQKVPLDQQSRMRQWHNLLQLVQRSLFWVEVIIVLGSATWVTLVFPDTRLYALFFLTQAILLPTIWMVVSLLDIVVDFVSDRYLHQWAKSAQIDNPSSNRYALRVNTYSPAIQGATTLLFVALGIYLTILAFGINPSVLASAGAAAVIIAFLSRNLLEDMLNGALILWTDRYAIGDVIQVDTIVGLVENMNLYVTQIRGEEGRLATIPNGQIRIVENLTKDWSRVDFKIEIAYNADVAKALEIIQEVSERMRSEEPWNERILEPASILGVDAVTHAGILIQVWIKTQPIQQFAVGREFRLRIKQAFDEAGIALGVPQQEVNYRNGNALPWTSSDAHQDADKREVT